MSRFQVTISKTEFFRPSKSFSSRKESVLWYHWRNLPFFLIVTSKLSKDEIYVDKSTFLTTLYYFVNRETCQGKTLMWWHKDQRKNWWNNKMRGLSETILGFSVLLFKKLKTVSMLNFSCSYYCPATGNPQLQPCIVWVLEINFLLTWKWERQLNRRNYILCLRLLWWQ